MWKAFAELEAIGFIGTKRPRMVAVQAAGCAPMVRAFEAGTEHAPRWEDAHTIASGIRVPQAVGDFLILRAVRESKGFAIAVTDEKISSALNEVAREEGLLLCPEGAATYAAYQQSLAEGRVAKSDRVMLFNCATGLKYPLPKVDAHARSLQADRLRETLGRHCERSEAIHRRPKMDCFVAEFIIGPAKRPDPLAPRNDDGAALEEVVMIRSILAAIVVLMTFTAPVRQKTIPRIPSPSWCRSPPAGHRMR